MTPKHGISQALAAFVGCVLICAAVGTQTADDVEKTIAKLPPEQRVYERFRLWVNSLPADQQQHDARLGARYREYLMSRGFSDTDADAQLKLVREQSARAEVERWNQIL